MFTKQEVVAMILAGGQGSRLGVLTKKLAKPAVPYGGKYRIIDFSLSNCVNSGIETVGVLTQYQPLILNEYIGSGKPWDLDCMNGGVQVLPPFQRSGRSDWYKGTANAIYQNLDYIDRYNPDYVVILSGDHIYKMNYYKMIAFHKSKKAACTIAAIDVPEFEAPRLGILNTNPDGSVYEFEEKPENPKSTKASMGVYVFNSDVLREYLIKDEENESSSKDFGKNVIPSMLKNAEKIFAYEFNGYWKDVGTISSLWEANMDLLDPNSMLDLSDESWKIYSRNPIMPPHYVSESAYVQNSLISDGCNIYGTVDSSIIFSGAYVEKGAVVRDSIIMPYSYVGKNAEVNYSIIAENVKISSGAKIGNRPENFKNKNSWGITVVGENRSIGENVVVPAKAMVTKDLMEVKESARK